MKKTLLRFEHFKAYASFLLEHHIDRLMEVERKRTLDVELPMLAFVQHLSDEQRNQMLRKSIVDLLTSIVEGTVVETVEKAMDAWKKGLLPAIPKEKLSAADIALLFNVRKHALLSVLPEFTQEAERLVSIVKEMEDFYAFQEGLAIETFSHIQREELQRKKIRLKEAQRAARLGFWDYEPESRTIVWSEELYEIYGLNPLEPLVGDRIQQMIYEEDLQPLLHKVRKAYQEKGTFSHEYRIRRVDGQTRILFDKGYTETELDGKTLVKGISQDITDRKRIEEELKGRELILQEAQSLAHLGSWEWDTAVNVVHWSDELYRLFGYEPSEVALDYERYLDHIHPEDRNVLKQHVADCFSHMTPYALEHRIITKGGDIKWLLAKGRVTHAQGDRVLKMAGVAMDITEQKHAILKVERSEALLLETQALAHVGSYEWSLEAGPSTITQEISRIFGFEDGKITLPDFFGMIHTKDRKRVEQSLEESIQTGNPYIAEFRIHRRSDHALRHVWTIGKVVYDLQKKPQKMVGTVMDITDRKLAEDALKAKTEALIASNKELEAFCYTISHDLRSPLRAIDGFGKILASKYTDVLDQEGQRLLDIVRNSAQRMGVLIDSLLDFSRLNRKEMYTHTLPMEELVHTIWAECLEQNPDCRATLRLQPLANAAADKELLRQVWHNLLSNAIKFSSKAEVPVVEVSSQEEDKQVVYCVRDNGAGFEMQYADKLFGVFQRLHGQQEFPGTGVGLATVQRIVHRHGGHVWAEGARGQGASFYFTLPKQSTRELVKSEERPASA